MPLMMIVSFGGHPSRPPRAMPMLPPGGGPLPEPLLLLLASLTWAPSSTQLQATKKAQKEGLRIYIYIYHLYVFLFSGYIHSSISPLAYSHHTRYHKKKTNSTPLYMGNHWKEAAKLKQSGQSLESVKPSIQ